MNHQYIFYFCFFFKQNIDHLDTNIPSFRGIHIKIKPEDSKNQQLT